MFKAFQLKIFQRKPMLSKTQVWLVLLSLWLAATGLRVLAVQNGNFPFWFDLGRDAIISREILENNDLKIQGPNASGTNDTIYHGVMYYYIIGPLYTWFGGDPQAVLNVVIAISSLSVVPIFLLARSFSEDDRVALLTGWLYVFSYEFFTAASWLSNPVIAVVSLPLFFYLYWQIFFKEQRRLFPWLLLSLAISHQAAVVYAPWWGLVLVGLYLEYQRGTLKKWPKKYFWYGGVLYLLGISSMILAQLKAYQAGIFTPQSIVEFAGMSSADQTVVGVGMLRMIYLKIVRSLLPSLPVLSFLMLGNLFFFAKNSLRKSQQQFVLIVLSSPLWLLAWHYRYVYHAFITLEFIALILLAMTLVKLYSKKLGGVLVGLAMIVFIFSNVSAYRSDTLQAQGTYFVPQGTYFKHLLQTIDFTYQQADGQDFSISTMTNPYGYNTMWAYLYHWYGLKKYGYTPYFYGPDQTGLFGGDLLERTSEPAELHFSIREPGEGMPIWLFNDFDAQQELIAKSNKFMFGTLDVREHHVSEE